MILRKVPIYALSREEQRLVADLISLSKKKIGPSRIMRLVASTLILLKTPYISGMGVKGWRESANASPRRN